MMETDIVWGEPIAVDYPNKPDWLADGTQIYVIWHDGSQGDWFSEEMADFDWPKITHIKLPADHPHYAVPSKWGDPIEVNGVRPEWLGDDELTVIKLSMDSYGTGPQELHVQQIWWESTSAIRLPRDHPAYTAIAAGFTPWGGGESAPDDWDGGEVLRADGFVPLYASDWRRSNINTDIIGYHKAVEAVATPEDMIADFYQEFGGAVIGTDNPRHLRILDALADIDETTVVVKRMSEVEARDMWDRNSSDFGSSDDDFIVCLAEMGIILPEPTPLDQFIAANPGVVNDENRAAVEMALGWGS